MVYACVHKKCDQSPMNSYTKPMDPEAPHQPNAAALEFFSGKNSPTCACAEGIVSAAATPG